MGNKKQNSGPRSNQSKSDSGTSSSCAIQSESSAYSTIKLECERALNSLKHGNHNKALKLMKELYSKHGKSAFSAFIHRVQGMVCHKMASIIDDPSTKQRHLKNATESARKAVELSPCSIEYAKFYANLLYESAKDSTEYEQVVKECERALWITNSIDPAMESLKDDESQQEISTAEKRILHVQNELRLLIQKSNIASLLTWAKDMGMGKEKPRLSPIKRATEEPMEVRPVQTIRPNEMKKVTKIPEERRKEIEFQVTVERLLRQMSKNEGDRDDWELGSSSGSGKRRLSKRQKHGHDVRKAGSTSEKRDLVCLHWNSMGTDLKEEFLRIRVCDFKCHWGSPRDTLLNALVKRALSYAEGNKTWKVWLCSNCRKEFSDSETHRQHVVHEHVENLLPEMQKLLPQNVDNEWIEKNRSCSWKPLDASAAVKMLENQTKSEETSIKEAVEVEGSVAHSLVDGWPLSDDSERAKLLKKIHVQFDMLIRHKYLAASHVNKVLKFTMDEIQGLAGGSQLLNHCLDQSPTCICFLGVLQLKKIVKFLLELSHACGLVINADKSTSPTDDLHNSNQISEIKENIVLNEDATSLLLDECLVPAEITPGATESAAMDDVITPTSNDVLLHKADPFLSWIFSGSSWDDQLTSCLTTREDNRVQGLELVQTLENEFYQLQNLSEKKCERTNCEKALQVVEDLCLEEGKKRENSTESVQRSYGFVLRKRREELIESEKDVMNVSNGFELDAIKNVLQEAEAMNDTGACNLESGEDNEGRMKDYLHILDSYIEIAIEKLKEELSLELSKIDAEIMRSLAEMQRLELKLEPVSAFDYRAILLPLVKTYLRENLEDSAEKDASKKSDAARDEFLAELACVTVHDNDLFSVLQARDGHEQHIPDTTNPESSSAGRHDEDRDSIPVSSISDDLEQKDELKMTLN